ncbi:hypothetical protein chiPu_0020886 [Chiloscyllium punctatum]|uniref:C2 domain-containing protein n=1 Tax=Chiloscyllium punctatum TaxID=137246 RepID=A0A401RKR4_CHIPU|nr:hypothetical protein [Chiloscyllium punctatum]
MVHSRLWEPNLHLPSPIPSDFNLVAMEMISPPTSPDKTGELGWGAWSENPPVIGYGGPANERLGVRARKYPSSWRVTTWRSGAQGSLLQGSASMSLLAQSQQWYPTHVKVVVIRARGLRSKGKDGTNDAYAIMQLGKEQYSSSVAEKTAAPQWREEAEFELPPLQSGRGEKSTLRLTVMHRALVGLDKFLGQAAISLSELYGNKTRSKVGWYKLYSKAGKADKERGEIEADIQFVRNNMTASMFDLSGTDKSRSTLGKLKDRLKGKKRGGFSDSASAIVPSLGTVADSDGEDELPTGKAATTSRLKKLFPKSNLQRSSLSQSMSVIPTAPSSPPGGTRDRDSQGFTEIKLHDLAGGTFAWRFFFFKKKVSCGPMLQAFTE